MPSIDQKNNVVSVDGDNVHVSAEFFQSVLDVLAASGSGVSVDVKLSNAGLGVPELEALGQALGNTQATISSLDLSANNIWAEGLNSVRPALKNVVQLSLDHNHLGDEGACLLASCLVDAPLLTSLSLDQNAIGNDGTEQLSAAVADHQSLITLSLRTNEIEELGARTLANMLAGLGLTIGDDVVEEEEEPEDPKKAGKKKGGKPEAKTDEQLEKEKQEREEKEARKRQAEIRRSVASKKNDTLVELFLDNNPINKNGYGALSDGIRGHPNLLRCTVDELSEPNNPGARAARDSLQQELATNQRKRVAIIQHAFFMGLHPRVGCCSPVMLLNNGGPADFDLRDLQLVWDFLGPV